MFGFSEAIDYSQLIAALIGPALMVAMRDTKLVAERRLGETAEWDRRSISCANAPQFNCTPAAAAPGRMRTANETGRHGIDILFSDGHARGIYPRTYPLELPKE
jgi:hypothetical protein